MSRQPATPRSKTPDALPASEPGPVAGERVQKVLAAAGLASRRLAEALIEQGRVHIDGRRAMLGDRVRPGQRVALDGAPVTLRADAPVRVIAYHKPVGELVTRDDPAGRGTVFDRLPPPASGRWIAVGRLDLNTSGLLLLTDDGALAHGLMHPSRQVLRSYRARVQGRLTEAALECLRTGVTLDDGPARFERLVERAGGGGTNRWYEASLREGRNREVRRLFEAVGGRVARLMRIAYGGVRLPADLPPGAWRELSPAEVTCLSRLAERPGPRPASQAVVRKADSG